MDSRRDPSQLDRRHFARAASSGLALFAIPGWFAACARPDRRSDGSAAESADERPLLVLHVADDRQRRSVLGELFGIFLVHGEHAQLAPLATCDLECATTAELADCGLDLTDVHAVLKVPGRSPVAALSGKFPREELYGWEWERQASEVVDSIRLNHDWMARQLAKVLGPGSPAFERGLALERRAGTGFDEAEAPDAARVQSAPCHALAAADANPATREAWNLALTNFAVNRWSDAPPRGSSWATARGCGVSLDTPLKPRFGFACGMGRVPLMAQRFLYLFSAEELQGG